MPPCDNTGPNSSSYNEVSFNPCFSGCRPATNPELIELMDEYKGFNPCFSGCRPATAEEHDIIVRHHEVSILVLVDAALRRQIYNVMEVTMLKFQSLF